MIATTSEPPATAPSRRRTAIAIAAAVTTLVVTTLVILIVGWVPVPELPSLDDEPDLSIAGTIVYVAESNERGTCLVVIDASGTNSRQLPCLSAWTESVSWTADGTIAVTSYDELGPRIEVLDPVSGGILETIQLGLEGREFPEPLPSGTSTRGDGTRVITGDGQRPGTQGAAVLIAIAPDATRTTIADLAGPRDYAFQSVQWSPDGNWVLASDSRGRLIIVADDGDPGPRLLVDSGDDSRWDVPAAWYLLGHHEGTLDLAEIRAGAATS